MLAKIQDEIKYYQTAILDCNPNFAQTTPEVLELIDLYSNSKYKGGDRDSSGWRKPFFNIVDNPVMVAAQMTDLDVKDIQVMAEEGQSYWPSWIMEKDFRIWAKTKQFGQLLNEIIFNLPKCGHIVLKKTQSGIKLVNLKNIKTDPTVRWLKDSNFVIEEHEYTLAEFRREGKERKWENVEEIADIYKEKKQEKIKVYERYGEAEDSVNNFFIVAGSEVGVSEDKSILFQAQKELPYREMKWEEVPGRWLGRGQVEKLFEAQIAKNENEYYFRKGLRWTSLHIFQSRDETVARNLLTDVEDGQLLNVLSEIQPVEVEERNLSAYNYADSKWEQNIADRAFKHEPLSGERPPAGTPLGTSILQVRMAGRFYGLKQEEIGLFLREMIFDWVIPDFKTDKKARHELMFATFEEEELDKLRNLLIQNQYEGAIWDFIARNGYIPTSQERDILKGIVAEKVKRKKSREIPDDYYENVKFKIDVVITGEQIDVAQKVATAQTVLQLLFSNPQALDNKKVRSEFYRMLNWLGYNPKKLEMEEEPSLMQAIMPTAPRGGSVAAPAAPSPQPAAVTAEKTL